MKQRWPKLLYRSKSESRKKLLWRPSASSRNDKLGSSRVARQPKRSRVARQAKRSRAGSKALRSRAGSKALRRLKDDRDREAMAYRDILNQMRETQSIKVRRTKHVALSQTVYHFKSNRGE